MLINSPKILKDYKEYLLESLKKADLPTKKQILQIFNLFIEQEDLEEVVSELMLLLENPDNMSNQIIETILSIVKKDNFGKIHDFEWLFFEILGKLTKKIDTKENAVELSDMLIVRFYIFSFYLSILESSY